MGSGRHVPTQSSGSYGRVGRIGLVLRPSLHLTAPRAVLQVPRVAAGQESGSTFAATFNANMWSMQAISRLQAVVTQGINGLLLRHLEMSGIVAERKDLPTLKFEPVDEENNYQEYQRVSLGFRDGIITRDEAREMLGFPEGITEGFKDGGQSGTRPISPRPQQQDTNSGGEPDDE